VWGATRALGHPQRVKWIENRGQVCFQPFGPTLLGAELVGRAYGGGMLKLEPREADQLPVPTPELVRAASAALRARRPAVRAALARGDLLGAVRHIDQVLLREHMELPEGDHAELVAAHAVMTARRVARGATRLRPDA